MQLYCVSPHSFTRYILAVEVDETYSAPYSNLCITCYSTILRGSRHVFHLQILWKTCRQEFLPVLLLVSTHTYAMVTCILMSSGTILSLAVPLFLQLRSMHFVVLSFVSFLTFSLRNLLNEHLLQFQLIFQLLQLLLPRSCFCFTLNS